MRRSENERCEKLQMYSAWRVSFAAAFLVPALIVHLFVDEAQGIVLYDAVSEFSTTVNSESSRWSYRETSGDLTRDGSYDLLPNFDDPLSSGQPFWLPGTPYWNSTGFTGGARIGVNQSGGSIARNPFFAVSIFWPNNTIWLHPWGLSAADKSLAVVSWLSPGPGFVEVEFSIADIDPGGGNGIAWFIDLGDSTGVLASGTIANGGSTGLLNVSTTAVSAGDRINIIIDANGNQNFDSTALTAEITFIPEPSAFCLAALGLLGIGWRRRKLA